MSGETTFEIRPNGELSMMIDTDYDLSVACRVGNFFDKNIKYIKKVRVNYADGSDGLVFKIPKEHWEFLYALDMYIKR